MTSDPNNAQSDGDRVGEVSLTRRIDHSRDLLIVTGDFENLVSAYLDHARRWENDVDPLGITFMRQGLGAATLHLSCRPAGEFVGWTINLKQPPTNLFLTGDSSHFTVTGRVFTESVKTFDSSRMFVQTTRAGDSTPTQSAIAVDGIDVCEIFEQYYMRSEQNPAHFLELDENQFTMVLGLPGVDIDWMRSLDRAAIARIAEEDHKILNVCRYKFQCGCTPERIIQVALAAFRQQLDDLFRGDDGVDALCPRCGRRWWITREEFEKTLAADDEQDDATAGD